MRTRRHLLAALLLTFAFNTTARAQLYAPAGPGATLYVANRFGGGIERYNPPSGNGTPFDGSSNSPYGLAFDIAGNLYVATGGNRIEVYSNTGGVLFSRSTIFDLGISGSLSSPRGLAFDSSGNLYAANSGNNTIEKYTSTGGVLSSTGTPFGNAGNLFNPQGLAFDSTGNLYAVDNGTDAIVKYTNAGGVLSGNGTRFFTGGSPTGLAFDSADNLYVANGNTIILYPNTGGVLSNAGTQFTNSGLSGPTFLAFAPAPEPSSTVLLLVGLSFAAQRRRTKA